MVEYLTSSSQCWMRLFGRFLNTVQNIQVLKLWPIYNFICFVFKNLNVNELLYFQKTSLWIFFQDLEDNTVCSNTSVLASDEVVTYWACRRVSRSLFIVTSFSVDRAWRIKLFWFQKVEVIFKVKILLLSKYSFVFKCGWYIF